MPSTYPAGSICGDGNGTVGATLVVARRELCRGQPQCRVRIYPARSRFIALVVAPTASGSVQEKGE